MGDIEKKTSSISSESSSIGAPSNGTEQGHDDFEEVMSEESAANEGGLGSFGSMLDSLPTHRRGLSENYNGKCKSLADLSEAITVKDLEKKEHPFNQWKASLKARKMYGRFMAQFASTEIQGEVSQQEETKEAEQNLLSFKP